MGQLFDWPSGKVEVVLPPFPAALILLLLFCVELLRTISFKNGARLFKTAGQRSMKAQLESAGSGVGANTNL